jgi:hypothetical protein
MKKNSVSAEQESFRDGFQTLLDGMSAGFYIPCG